MVIYNDFAPFSKEVWGASDTETFTYIDGVKVSNDDLKRLGKTKNQAFFRQHASVRVWAWQFSNGRNFFVTNDFDEYIDFLCEHKVKAVWFYNAKFDFAQIDYQLLTHNPVYRLSTEEDGKEDGYRYESLHNDKGGRYSLKLWTPYKAHGKGSRGRDRHEHVHSTAFYDFCNIFGGGLATLLKEFDVKDFNGNIIRKSQMDYQGVDEFHLTESDLNYLKNDTCGLYHLIRIANETLKELTTYDICKAKPDVMTAGGLAKKMLLRFLYPKTQEKFRKEKFQKEHPLTLEQDKFLREHRLYNGGLCILNDYFAGRVITEKMNRYDVNSEYPFIMSQMADLQGDGVKMTAKEWEKLKNKESYERIFVIEEMHGNLLKNKIPCFRNGYSGKFESVINVEQTYLIFEEEFNELLKWYDIEYELKYYIVYKKRNLKGYNDFVQTFYKLKNESKKRGDKAKTKFAKLLLNSSYGKLAERVARRITWREINAETGAVHLVSNNEQEIDEKSMLSVVQGAYVTALARVWILSHIREICNEDVLHKLIYCDTDSVHVLAEYDKADPFNLGGFKNEGTFTCCKYIAPKCYFDGKTDENGAFFDLEIHSKGLSIKLIEEEFKTENGWKTVEEVNKRFSYGEKFQPLSGMNIKGGKALIPIEKYLAKPVQGFFDSNIGLNEA